MKHILTYIFILLFTLSYGQVTFDNIPLDKQLIGRDLDNFGHIIIEGEVSNSSVNYDTLLIELYRDNVYNDSFSSSLNYNSGLALFNFDIPILAELSNYSIKIYGQLGISLTIEKEIVDIVAGDVYIIQGQSNAVARIASGSERANSFENPFIRVYASGTYRENTLLNIHKEWYIGQGDGSEDTKGNTGQWGLKLANSIVTATNIPVAIFNGARGGQEIDYFLAPNDYQTSTAKNYGRLYYRLNKTGLNNYVRSVLWSQGEHDGMVGTSTTDYKNKFNTLKSSWLADYPNIEHFYIFQTKNGCLDILSMTIEDLMPVKEAQRQLAYEDLDISIMSTAALTSSDDKCHFNFIDGYESFADRIFPLIRRDLDGVATSGDANPPMIIAAYLQGNTTLIVETDAIELEISADAPVEDFDFELSNAGTSTITNISVSQNKIVFTLSENPGTMAEISYLAQAPDAVGNFITNTMDLELVCFNKYPVDMAPPVGNESLIISEIMQNPNDVVDANGQYFEVYNATSSPIDMNGWVISDGSDSHTISSSVIVPAFGFAVLGNNGDSQTNGGVIVDYEYSVITLANVADEIVLTDGSSTEIDRVEYDGGSLWPDPGGAAMIYIGSDIEDNNDGSLWAEATVAEGINVDFGSPGINGTDQIVAYLVFSSSAWSTVPTALTGARTGFIKSNESTSFTTDVSLDNLFIKEGADLTITSGNTLTVNSLVLGSISTSYSSLILDGTVTGVVNYERHVNLFTGTAGGNDLISAPLSGQTWTGFLASGSNASDLLDNGNTTLTAYAFAPFDKTATPAGYVNYTDDTATTIESGIGFRAATDSGTTLTFTGTPLNGLVNTQISNDGIGSEEWNLIGNPYASYISAFDFLNHNINNNAVLEMTAGAIYGYNGLASNKWEILNLSSVTDSGNDVLIAPGQGFFVASGVPVGDIQFTTAETPPEPDMRRTGSGDDFISGRTAPNQNLELQLSTSLNSFKTDFYFNNNSSLGLDPGYDAKIYGQGTPTFSLYSHLVEENTGVAMGIQSLGVMDLTNTSIPLGVNANQGEQLRFRISVNTLPAEVSVYLDDTVAGTSTLLNSGDYILTPDTNLSGTGRFYLHVTDSALSTPQNTLDNLRIYTNDINNSVVIACQLLETTTAKIYDLQGRVVSTSILDTTNTSQTIDVSSLSTGVYLVELSNATQNKTQKVIIK